MRGMTGMSCSMTGISGGEVTPPQGDAGRWMLLHLPYVSPTSEDVIRHIYVPVLQLAYFTLNAMSECSLHVHDAALQFGDWLFACRVLGRRGSPAVDLQFDGSPQH